MKKLKLIALSLLALVVVPLSVNAASGKISVSGSSTVVVGNKVTVTVTLSGSDIGSWNMNLNYDKSYLQLTSTNSESGGTKMVNSSTSGVSKKTYTFTFKTLKKGSTTVKVNSYEAYKFSDLSEIDLTSTGKTIKIITQEELEASYSKNNDLASLGLEGIDGLTPQFNKDTLEYSIIVPEDTKEITIIAKAADAKSSASGIGKHEVTSGTNTFEIVVRAENGSEKTYKLTVDVKDASPIVVNVDGSDKTVVKIRENLPNVSTYQEKTIKINDFDIPAYYNEFTDLTLVGLKSSDGTINLYIYNENDNTYTSYHEIGLNKVVIYPLDPPNDINGYEKVDTNIDGVSIKAYSYQKNSRFLIVYGINIENGEKSFYLYDKTNQSLTKYNDEYIKALEEKNLLFSYIILGFSAICVLLIIVIIILCVKKRKNKKPKVTEVKFEDKISKQDEMAKLLKEKKKRKEKRQSE